MAGLSVTDEAADARARVEETRKIRARVAEALPEFCGLRAEQAVALARERNFELRVIQRADSGWYTCDDVHNRVTVEVENGVVISALKG